jgi:ATP-dependent Clp endopeptidase proteolytic subunit ClpP
MGSEDIYFENYRLIAKLGSGAFGHVYKAQHVILTTRIVAIKILRPELTEDEEAVLRFLKESQYLYELKHPYILPIIDAGISSSNGVLFQVTEYASKGSLRTRLQRQAMHPLPLMEAITIISQVGQALEYAHAQNIVHRDLKPENILFNEKEAALVADFGIATVLNTSSIKHTNAVGTYQYMAPEEYQDLVCKESDQYALGCIAYELFTGHLPFQASSTASIIAKHLTEEPHPPRKFNPELPERIETAILKALAKQRSNRHADISAFVTALITTPIGLRKEKTWNVSVTSVNKANEVHEAGFGQNSIDPRKGTKDESFDSQDFDELDESKISYDSLYGLIQTSTTPETRRLLEERIIFIGTPIDENVANLVVAQLLYLQREDATKDINLYINSPGGVIYAGLTIYDTIQWLKPDVSTVCVGMAYGFAAILLAAGAKGKRFALPTSVIGLVPVQGGAEGSKADIEITTREIIRLRRGLIEILAEHTGQSPERIMQDMDKLLRLNAREAVSYGIVDEVLIST